MRYIISHNGNFIYPENEIREVQAFHGDKKYGRGIIVLHMKTGEDNVIANFLPDDEDFENVWNAFRAWLTYEDESKAFSFECDEFTILSSEDEEGVYLDENNCYCRNMENAKRYTDLSEAKELIERMREDGDHFFLTKIKALKGSGVWKRSYQTKTDAILIKEVSPYHGR